MALCELPPRARNGRWDVSGPQISEAWWHVGGGTVRTELTVGSKLP